MARTASLQTLRIAPAQSLQGRARRVCMARTGNARGPGGHQRAARARRWGRRTMRQGPRERARGGRCSAALRLRGRRRAAEPLPPLLPALRTRGDSQSQAAPPCRSPRLSTRLTAAEVRRPWLTPQGSLAATRPPAATLGPQWHARGDSPQHVAKRPPHQPSRPPPPSSPRELRSSGRRRPRTRRDAWPGRPKRPSTSGRVRGVASAASRRWLPSTPCTQRPP